MASDKTVLLAATQTLTNKTLTSPTITNATLTIAALNGDLSGTSFLDEDDLSSNSATKVASQQSIKAYIDSGTVTMTNKTLTGPTINTPTINTPTINTPTVSGKLTSDNEVECASLDVDGNSDLSGTLNIGASTTRKVMPAGTFVSNADGSPNISSTLYNISAISSFTSVGPTGGGGSGTWTALDSVPDDADWIEVSVIAYGERITGAADAQCYLGVAVRENGSSVTVADSNRILMIQAASTSTGYAYATGISRAKVPVSSLLFDVVCGTSGFTNAATCYLRLDGWGFNP